MVKKPVEKFTAQEEGYYSFIMMNVMMPEMNGFEATKAIQEWERTQNREKKVDIYFVSGEYLEEEEVAMTSRLAGLTNEVSRIKYLRKPIELEAVKAIVKQYKRDR